MLQAVLFDQRDRIEMANPMLRVEAARRNARMLNKRVLTEKAGDMGFEGDYSPGDITPARQTPAVDTVTRPAGSEVPTFDPIALRNGGATDTENKERTAEEEEEIKAKERAERAGFESDVVPMDFNTWLPFAAKHYRISRNPEDYVLVPVICMPADIPNRNACAFPLHELVEFNPERGQQAYKTWRGKPTHYEHCFPGDAPVLTEAGFVKIKKIKVGDKVLTHNNRYKAVTKLFSNGRKKLTQITCQGLGERLLVTENHPMWVVDKRQIFGKIGISGGGSLRHRKDKIESVTPHFRSVSDVYAGDYLVIPIRIGGSEEVDSDLAFITGVFAAEGSFEKYKEERNATVLTLGFKEAELRKEVERCLKRLGYEYTVYEKPRSGVASVRIKGREFADLMFSFVGEYSHQKQVKQPMMKWDEEALKQFIGGYISGDGHVKSGGGRVRCVTVSPKLATDIQNILAFLGLPATLTRNGSGSFVSSITGKEYNRKTSWHVGLGAEFAAEFNDYVVGKDATEIFSYRKNSSRLIVVGDLLLTPILKVERNYSKESVYNIEVEEDHTYTAYNVVVHNCNTDITKAYGVIVDSYMRKFAGFSRGKLWKVLLLCAFDRTKNPRAVNKILSGESNSYSMGAWVNAYTCSLCGGVLGESCPHLDMKDPTRMYELQGRLVCRNATGIEGFENSIVADPAYVSAISDTLIRMRDS
jgi:intein/homing endonuclease